MGFRFQQRVTLFPGVRVNFSAHGISASVGPRGASVTLGTQGTMLNLGLPGTGMSYRAKIAPSIFGLGGPTRSPSSPQADSPSQATDIQSVQVAEATSDGLQELKALIKAAKAERETLRRSIPVTREELAEAEERLAQAKHWFFRLFLGRKVPEREEAVKVKAEQLRSQEERLEGAFIDAQFALDEAAQATFEKLVTTFEQLAGCACIWDITSEESKDRRVARSHADRSLTRKVVEFSLSEDPVLQAMARVLRFRNANGSDLLLYPGFFLMQDGDELALIDLREVHLTYRQGRFVEVEPVPRDAAVVGTTWKKCNQDGSPDRRFADNRQIPIVGYGHLALKSDSGLNEEYQVSCNERAERFATAFVDYQNRLRALGDRSPTSPATESLAREVELRCLNFIRTAEALSAQHAMTVAKDWTKLIYADARTFTEQRPLALAKQFVHGLGTVPGEVEEFLRRTPGTASVRGPIIAMTSERVAEALGLVRKRLEEAPSEARDAAETQHVLRVIQGIESTVS